MDVHVAGVADVERGHRGGDIVHVVHVQVVDVAVMEVVQVVAMGDGRVATPRVMRVIVRGVGLVVQGRGIAHGEQWSHIVAQRRGGGGRASTGPWRHGRGSGHA